MTPADIGWTISFIFWLVAIIIGRTANKHGYYEVSNQLWPIEVVSLAVMWIFIGKIHGWW